MLGVQARDAIPLEILRTAFRTINKVNIRNRTSRVVRKFVVDDSDQARHNPGCTATEYG